MIYECKLTAMEDIFFASREFGKEYITEGLIGNTALPYAMNLVSVNKNQYVLPHHKEDFALLNEKKIFVTPCTFESVQFAVDYYNARPDRKDPLIWTRSSKDKKGNEIIKIDAKGRRVNMPDEGWIRFIKKGSMGYFYVLSEEKIDIPSYIRVGKFMSKCKIEPIEIGKDKIVEKNGEYETSLILRLQDIPKSYEIIPNKVISISHGDYMIGGKIKGNIVIIKSKFINTILPKNISFYGREIE